MTAMKPWIQTYLPKTTQEVIGQNKAIEQLRSFVSSFPKNKVCVLHGGIGSGKTSSVVALTNELGYELVEMNASDFRNKDAINAFIGTAMKQRSLFHSSKIILVDELDGLSGTKDRGAIAELLSLIKDSAFPVICTVQDAFDKKLKTMRSKAVMIEFSTLDYRSIANNLKRILDDVGCAYDEDVVKTIARRCGGDMRAAINDAQTITGSGTQKLDKTAIEAFVDHERHKTEKLTNALMLVMKSTSADLTKKAFDNVDDDMDTIGLWLEENIPKEYEGKDLARAMNCLSKADVYKGRIRRWQHWRFLVYISALYSAGVATSKDEKYKKFIPYVQPSKLLTIWKANQRNAKKKALAEKLAPHFHTSSKRVMYDMIPYISKMCKNEQFLNEFCEKYNIKKEEIV